MYFVIKSAHRLPTASRKNDILHLCRKKKKKKRIGMTASTKVYDRLNNMEWRGAR